MQPRRKPAMSAAAASLLWLASCAAAQISSIKDPLTGEPIELIKGSDFRRRRKLEATCPEAIDEVGETLYHPTIDRHAGPLCTNSNHYPQTWKEIPIAETIPQYVSTSADECCEKFFGRHGVPLEECIIEDVCAEKPVYWHSAKDNPLVCTNSGDYPPAWNQPMLKRYHLFKDPEDCCLDVEKKYGGKCDYRDIFEPWDCNKWHLSIEADDNSNLVNQDGACTNSGVIHEVWLAHEQHYVFPNHQACCDKFNIDADKCAKVDMCVDGELPSNPIEIPTDAQMSDIICAEMWDPVCGEDGTTFSNECKASKMNVKVAYQGECLEQLSDEVSDVICAEIWDPVCGEDGKNYSNDCEAKKMSAKVAYKGECLEQLSEELSGVMCLKVWDPVCGEDDKDYANECEAKKMSIKVAFKGECRGQGQDKDVKEISLEKCSPGGVCSAEGSSCAVGTETCCGVTHDSLKCDCMGGKWMCYATEACMMPCSTVAAATTTTTAAEEIVTHSAELCGKWHISREYPNTCTNSGVGTKDPPADCTGWYQTGEECCEGYFGHEDCKKMDVSVTTTLATPTSYTVTTSTVESATDAHLSDIICAEIYDPVCGEDGKNYSNDCEATKMSAKVAYKGECLEELSEELSDLICPEMWDPVCGEDGTTFSNDCKASKMNVKVAYQGECIKELSDVLLCAKIWAPVCGDDDQDYPNECEAKKMSVKVAYKGECQKQDQDKDVKEITSEKCFPGGVCSVEGSTCADGTETCCGVTHDSLKCDCMGGKWMCYATEACMMPCSTVAVAATTTSTTAAEEIVTHSAELCGKWHVSREAPMSCTNSQVGVDESFSNCAERYKTGEECCMGYYGKECSMIDVTGEASTKPAISHCNEWHIDEKNPRICTNSEDYPSFWRENYYSKFFFSSPEACCEQISDCRAADVCALCSNEYSPVCGSDKLTYENECKARAAGMVDYVEGECELETSTTTTPAATTTANPGDMEENSDSLLDSPFCTEEYAPVCGSDKLTYENKCKAKAAGILTFVEGKCGLETTTSTTPAVTTTSSTTSTTTTSSNPGEMEQNSDSLTTQKCQYAFKRRCKKNGCKWDRSTKTCYLEETSQAVTNETCSTWKKKSKCEDEGCVWSRRSKARKEVNCYAPGR